MMEPDKITPDIAKSWLDEVKEWRPIVREAIVLVTAIWLAVSAALNHRKLGNIEDKTDAVKTTTELVKDVATSAADTSKVNLVLNTEQRADYTGQKPPQVLAEAKASAEQLPTTGPVQ